MQIQQIFFFLDADELLESSSPLLPVVSLHEYTGLLKNNNKYSQKKYLAKNNRNEIECF